MKRKQIRIFSLILILVLLFTGYLKGCNSEEFPKQLPISTGAPKNYSISYQDSFIVVAAGKHYHKSKFHEKVYGKHYRELWALPVKMKVFDVTKEKGGFKILKRGGHMQTLSLRLETVDGKRYSIRTIDKDPSKALPPAVRNKLMNYLIRDQTSALNPYAALVIPKLAEAAGIIHTNPELFFIPYDKNLKEYADLFEGRVVILEEFPDESWVNTEGFGFSENIITTEELLQKRFASQNILIDQKSFVKARLFDLLINDWDRHTDQWKWAEYSEGKNKIYKPIPRDRDIAFYKFDSGILPFLVAKMNPKFQSFDSEFDNIKGMIKNARYIDAMILNGIDEEEFIKASNELQKSLTDQAIENAVKQWPKEVFDKVGNETIQKLKLRRDHLTETSKKYHKLLFDKVKIVGTDEEEKFIITRLNNNQTFVKVEDRKGNSIYNFTFDHRFTREINLFGLNGNDKFEINGKTDKGIIIKIYGGDNYDEIIDRSNVRGYTRKTRVYDSKGDNKIEVGEETEDLTTNDPDILYFDRHGVMRKW